MISLAMFKSRSSDVRTANRFDLFLNTATSCDCQTYTVYINCTATLF